MCNNRNPENRAVGFGDPSQKAYKTRTPFYKYPNEI